MTVSDLIESIAAALASGALRPDDVLTKNYINNLAVIRDGGYTGYIDLNTGTVDVWQP